MLGSQKGIAEELEVDMSKQLGHWQPNLNAGYCTNLKTGQQYTDKNK